MSDDVNLSRKLILEAREQQPDGSGGRSVVWRALGTVWADMRAGSGREDFIAGQPRARQKWKVIVRAAPVGSVRRPGPDQRLREGNRIFNILTVAEHDSRGRFLEMQAEEGVLP